MTINVSKTKAIITFRQKEILSHWLHSSLFLNNSIIENVTVHEHLGLILSPNLSLVSAYFKNSSKSFQKKLNLLKPLKYDLSHYTLKFLFKSSGTFVFKICWCALGWFSESDRNFFIKLTNRGHRGCNQCFKRVSLLNRSLNFNEISWIELIKKNSRT